MIKILFFLWASSFLAFALNLQTASQKELMSIKGIGPKKAQAIIQYRKSHSLHSAKDLINIKGFGQKLIFNVKNNVKKKTKSSSTKNYNKHKVENMKKKKKKLSKEEKKKLKKQKKKKFKKQKKKTDSNL